MADMRLCNRVGCEHAKRRHDDPIFEGGCNVENCECIVFLAEEPKIAHTPRSPYPHTVLDEARLVEVAIVKEPLHPSWTFTTVKDGSNLVADLPTPSEHPVELEVGVDAPTRLKTCAMCKVEKPTTEFYDKKDYKGAKRSYCKSCDSSRPTKQTATKQLKTRARHRAVSALVINHREEFERLLVEFTEQVRVEAEELGMDGSLPRRLKSGPKRKGETVLERLDVARCPECHEFHDAGHVCVHIEKAASA